jgi:hypothetical protein
LRAVWQGLLEMLWRPIGRMNDDDLHAIYQYLTHLPESQEELMT